jgi:predicted AlkP superfamily phosphohydrolase/phosphomutase
MTRGSGAVWSTFVTGLSPDRHQVWEHVEWDEASMRLVTLDLQRLRPFWADLAEDGYRVGVLDVPFSPLVGLPDGFEVVEWGSHFVIRGEMGVAPAGAAQVLADAAPHPLLSESPRPLEASDTRGRVACARACLEGVDRRADVAERMLRTIETDLAVVVFQEFHHAAHYLFHELAPPLAAYETLGLVEEGRPGPGLRDIVARIDAAVGRLADLTHGSLVLFSLHGMGPGVGLPSVLQPLLVDWGYAAPRGPGSRTMGDQLRGLLSRAKQAAPTEVKRLYHRLGPDGLQRALARPDRDLPLDWQATEAFSLPTEDHGFVRLNLRGREAAGIVDPSSARATLAGIEDRLRSTTVDGRALVAATQQTTVSGGASSRLPDLFVHWEEAVTWRTETAVDGTEVRVRHDRPQQTGQHVDGGFVVWHGPGEDLAPNLTTPQLVDRLVGSVRRR